LRSAAGQQAQAVDVRLLIATGQPPHYPPCFFSPLLAFFFLFGGGVCVGAEGGFFDCFGLGNAGDFTV
jgi:hypothetical protein